MREDKFDELVREQFGPLLLPKGFEVDRSEYCTFYRSRPNDIWHIILPDIGSSGAWYDVRVFATSPLIEADFDRLFPDSLGIPSGSFSLLHSTLGVGARQEMFKCRTESIFASNFRDKVGPAITQFALPYLDSIVDVKSLLPLINHEFYRGLSLIEVGNLEEGTKVLVSERERLSKAHDDSGRVSSMIQRIDDALRRAG